MFGYRFFLTLFVVVFYCGSFAQLDYARKVMDTLCSPHYDGRGYVNKGDVRSAKYLKEELQRIGAIPVKKHGFYQDYTLGGVNTFPYEITVALDDDTLKPGAEYLVNPYSGTVHGDFEVIEVNTLNWYSKYQESLDWNMKDRDEKIYALNFTDIKDRKKRHKIQQVAFETIRYMPCIWVAKDKQTFGVGRGQANYPLITIDSADYHLAKMAHIKINNKFIPNYETKNVIGMIPGKKKRKYVVFTAHYDHLGRMGTEAYFPGANDNASGCAMLLSLAKHYMKNPPKYSVVFCFFSGEEAGLEGSKYFVANPYFKLKKVQFVLNIDIMGGASKGITVVNGTKHQEAFDRLVRINEEHQLLDKVKRRGPTQNSDHHYFSEQDVPAFFIYSMGNVKNYHDIYDTAENTPLNKFNEVQELLIKFVEEL